MQRYKFAQDVGDAPSAADTLPSVVSFIVYALLFPVIIYRAISRGSRAMGLVGT